MVAWGDNNVLAIILKFITIVFGGILAGFIGSLTGLGGGTVLVTLLSIFYGVPIVFATGASLISTIATSAGSASAYTKETKSNKLEIALKKFRGIEKENSFVIDSRINNVKDLKIINKLMEIPSFIVSRSRFAPPALMILKVASMISGPIPSP